ncbi:MAG: ABC transporter substrate-binding protein [Thermomicrobiales bacterium]
MVQRKKSMDGTARGFSRRDLLAAAGGMGLSFSLRGAAGAAGGRRILAPRGARFKMVDELRIDLASEPDNLDPATTYDVDGWSIVHSVYDSLVEYGPSGELRGLLARSLTQIDPLTFEVKLRQGVSFHNGEPFTAESIALSHRKIVENKASQIAGNFAPITAVTTIDAQTVHLTLSKPAPWLPAQIAAWLACLPPAYAAANDILRAPVGTGPYRFVEWKAGESITLEANPAYFAGSPKGSPLAKRVIYRFVGDPSTRVADLRSGAVNVIRSVPVDQRKDVESGAATVIARPVSGCAWIRIPTDVAPFSDAKVRQAMNHAVDVDGIIKALLGGEGKRLANFFVENGLGYDPALAPYAYDPEKAKALFKEAGLPSGFGTTLEFQADEHAPVVEAIAAQLTDAGMKTTPKAVEAATFNQTWTDKGVAPLRFATWRPMFDPYTLLSLIVSKTGFISRHDNPNAQPLIDSSSTETDATKRAALLTQLGKVLHDEPAAIYLWNLTALYGVAKNTPAWSPRPDDYIIATGKQ